VESPWLYSNFIDALARELKEAGVASNFARRNRFQFNGKKSAVMSFNTTAAQKARCKVRRWKLFGEKVKVTSSYVYLGAIVTEDVTSWKAHVEEAIALAQRRSNDLLWVCRGDKGLRQCPCSNRWCDRFLSTQPSSGVVQ